MFTTTSKKKSKAILEAITLWGECRNIALNEDGSWDKPNRSYKAFGERLEQAGWKNANKEWCDGSFKQCFYKGSIAVKFPKCVISYSKNEIQREYEQWITAPSKFKRYLTRSYCLIDLVLIQDKVMVKCKDNKTKCDLNDLALKKFPGTLGDYGHNHGHSKKGHIKFFDWVYKRDSNHINYPERKLNA